MTTRLRQALVYSPGYLPMLHTMAEEARASGNRALDDAIHLLITEYTSHGDDSDIANALRRQAIDHYRETAKCGSAEPTPPTQKIKRPKTQTKTRMFVYSRKHDNLLSIYHRTADKDFSGTDAGTEDMFIVQAASFDEALRGAREWIACRADDTRDTMPDGVHLEEREYRSGKSYMTLRVL